MQALASVVRAIQGSAGRGGRLLYYCAFVIALLQDVFTGLVVPASLIWAASELSAGSQEFEPLLAAIVGTLWYGPDRVQAALTNFWTLRRRWQVLVAALGSYHRAATEEGIDGAPLIAPLRIKRRLRFGPYWSRQEKSAKKYWNGRVQSEADPVVLSDSQLRSLARLGVAMALSGDYDENGLRQWCVGMVADQARFDLSLLDSVQGVDYWQRVLRGYEGYRMRQSIEETCKDWTPEQWRQLGEVAEGIRESGIGYLRETGWLE